jgi:hypothetical protein
MEKTNEWPVLPAHRVHKREEAGLEPKDQSLVAPFQAVAEGRRQPRFKIEVDITIHSRTCGLLKGHSVDISESGIGAMLPVEAPLGENVELKFTLPGGAVTIHAMIRQKRAFRYGFEFVNPDSMHELIRRTCRDLAIDQSLTLAFL